MVAIWYQGQYYGPAVKADAVLPSAAPLQPPSNPGPSGPGLSYLTVLTDRQTARRPAGLHYYHESKEDPS